MQPVRCRPLCRRSLSLLLSAAAASLPLRLSACLLSAAFSLLTDLCAQCVEEGLLSVYELTHAQLTADEQRARGQRAQEQQPALFVLKDSLASEAVRGPFTAAELQQAVSAGELNPHSAVCRAVGSTHWTPLAEMQPALTDG